MKSPSITYSTHAEAGPHITPRETEAIHWIAQGRTIATTAVRMGCSPRTVRAHLDSARDKLDALTLPQLVSRCWESGILRNTTLLVLVGAIAYATVFDHTPILRPRRSSPYKLSMARRGREFIKEIAA